MILSILINAANKHDCKHLAPHIKNMKKYLHTPKAMATDFAWDVKKLHIDIAKKSKNL